MARGYEKYLPDVWAIMDMDHCTFNHAAKIVADKLIPWTVEHRSKIRGLERAAKRQPRPRTRTTPQQRALTQTKLPSTTPEVERVRKIIEDTQRSLEPTLRDLRRRGLIPDD